MKNAKKIVYKSIRLIKGIVDFVIIVLVISLFSILFFIFSFQNNVPSSLLITLIALVIAVIATQLLKQKLCSSLSKVFDSILHDLPSKYIHTISNYRSLYKTIYAIFSTTLDFSTSSMTTKYLLKEAELNALQGQINPHFLYNTLESICGLALMEGATQVAEMTEKLADLFRKSLQRPGILVTLKEEISSVDSYMAIQKFRFSDKFTFHKHINEEDTENILSCILPHFTLQPIVENAIYHGLETAQGKGEIHLYATLTQKRLLLKISDNGCGIPQQKLNLINDSISGNLEETACEVGSQHTGMALLNINLRIQKAFGDEYGIILYSTVGIGTDVNIILPCSWNNMFGNTR